MAFNISKRTTILIYSSIAIFLILLNALIYINSVNLDCNKCVLTLKQTKISGVKVNIEFNKSVKELYEGLVNGACLIKWSRVQGYYGSTNDVKIN